MPQFATRPPTRWLDDDQQHSWRSFVLGSTLLFDRLDDDLRRNHDVSLVEFEILVRLSEAGGSLRMAKLAHALAHSRSRVTHTVRRMEDQDLVERSMAEDDRRGVVARMTAKGQLLLENVAHTHVTGVRDHLVDLVSAGDLAAMGRVFDAVSDNLIADHPDRDIR